MLQAFIIIVVTSERKIVDIIKKKIKKRFINNNGERVRASMANSAIYFCTSYFINVRKMLTMNKIVYA